MCISCFMYLIVSNNKENIMQFQYEKSIKDDTPLQDQIFAIAKEFGDEFNIIN